MRRRDSRWVFRQKLFRLFVQSSISRRSNEWDHFFIEPLSSRVTPYLIPHWKATSRLAWDERLIRTDVSTKLNRKIRLPVRALKDRRTAERERPRYERKVVCFAIATYGAAGTIDNRALLRAITLNAESRNWKITTHHENRFSSMTGLCQRDASGRPSAWLAAGTISAYGEVHVGATRSEPGTRRNRRTSTWADGN